MTILDPTASSPSPGVAAPDRGRAAFVAALVISFGLAAIVGAYVDWLWWPLYSGIVLTIVTVPIVLIGAIAAALTHGLARRISLVALAVGIGLLVGQNLGPSRAELLVGDGTLALTLDGPAPASGSGGASCSTVADGTEISVSGDPNLSLDVPDEPLVSVWFEKGDRWEALRGGPRAPDGTMLVITVTPRAVGEDGTPSTIGMGADETSTVEIDYDSTGGTLRFADLVPLTGVDYTGESMDLSGTIEFTCEAPVAG